MTAVDDVGNYRVDVNEGGRLRRVDVVAGEFDEAQKLVGEKAQELHRAISAFFQPIFRIGMPGQVVHKFWYHGMQKGNILISVGAHRLVLIEALERIKARGANITSIDSAGELMHVSVPMDVFNKVIGVREGEEEDIS